MEILASLRARNYLAVFVCHSDSEMALARTLAPDVPRFKPTSADELWRHCDGASIGIVNRLHVALPLAGVGVPCIVIGNDSRLLMAEEVGLPHLFVGNVTASEVIDLAGRLLEERAQLSERLLTQREQAADRYVDLMRGTRAASSGSGTPVTVWSRTVSGTSRLPEASTRDLWRYLVIVALPERVLSVAELGRVHFVGIGGVGMSGIAKILLDRGTEVSGSDAKVSSVVQDLRARGATIAVGHDASHVKRADTVVVSTAIRDDNPEVSEARRLGVRIIPRAAALASVMRGTRSVTITGTHGKTTTTSMLAVALRYVGADPSFAIGGQLAESGVNAHRGSGEIFVAEADESDKSFLAYDPEIAIITNVEVDHLDFYGTRANYVAAFDDFADNVTGALVVSADDPGARDIGERTRDRGLDVHTFGESADADLRIVQVRPTGTGTSFDATWRGRELGTVTVQLPGRHNALNAAAALLTGLVLGFPSDQIRDGLASYQGTRRRFELKGRAGGVRVYDEYSHHPAEVAVMVAAARSLAGDGRVVVVFQPHLFSRTRIFAADFGHALGDADEVIVMDVYPARESPEPGVTGALVADRVPLPTERVVFEPSPAAVPGHVADRVRPGDVVVTCGAGDVTLLGPEILRHLGDRASESVESHRG